MTPNLSQVIADLEAQFVRYFVAQGMSEADAAENAKTPRLRYSPSEMYWLLDIAHRDIYSGHIRADDAEAIAEKHFEQLWCSLHNDHNCVVTTNDSSWCEGQKVNIDNAYSEHKLLAILKAMEAINDK
mgnify:CR=1 FL=1